MVAPSPEGGNTAGRPFAFLLVEKKGPVLEVWLNRPDKRNAISTAVEEEWSDALELAAGDPDIRVVTLQGKGPVFSAGADMKEFARTYVGDEAEKPSESGAPDGPQLRPDRREGAARRLWPPPAVNQPELPRSWFFRKTLIAGVHGFVGPYTMRMLAPFDFIIAAEGTRFSWEQARMGNQNHPLAIMAYQFPMRVIKQLLLLGGWFDAETARDIHMVQRVLPLPEVPDEVARWAESAAGLTTPTISAYKEGIHRMYELSGLTEIIAAGNNVNAHAAGSRGSEFHGTLNEKGLGEALKLRAQDVDETITRIAPNER